MLRRLTISALLAVCVALTASAHDLFLKLDSYFLQPHSKASVRLLNGTFRMSDGIVSRDRFRDVTLLAPELSGPIGESVAWRDEGKLTVMEIQTGGPGTYLVGVSTKPREIDLKAADFNDYLHHDGIPDVLAERKKKGELNKDVRERYSKHVRAVFQVGNKLSADYRRQLNYPVEIIPQQNPYALRVGQTMTVLCTLEGQPLPNQFVMAGWESKDGRVHTLESRTDSDGLARFRLGGAGKWYIKFIHMTPLSEPGLNYESKWASLTFEIKARNRG
ncbi:MAG: DUF4198 domain-containing protein [Pyrinomonadaceae bacterium]